MWQTLPFTKHQSLQVAVARTNRVVTALVARDSCISTPEVEQLSSVTTQLNPEGFLTQIVSSTSSSMAFLSHALHWLSLSRLFEFRAARSGPGPQESDLYGKDGPAHRRQLEHFARTFQGTVREHALSERSRFSTAQAYRDRAASWKTSSEEETATATETRRVYPTYYSDIYMSLVPSDSGGAYGREGLLESLADVSTWIDHCARDLASRENYPPDEETANKIWLDNKSCSDVLRLLVIEAATMNDDSTCRKRLSTLLLLANHPEVGLDGFTDDGMACCNIEVGLSALVSKTAIAFILLNLLLALTEDDQHGKLLRPCDTLENHKSGFSHGGDTLTYLLPRPAYMNTKCSRRMLGHALEEHAHAVEHVLFNPVFAPRESGRVSKWRRLNDTHPMADQEASFERDVLADRQILSEALKQMWKVLIFCEMLFREADSPINWEMASLDTLAELFRGKAGLEKVLGQPYDYYEAEREENGGSWSFYTNSGDD